MPHADKEATICGEVGHVKFGVDRAEIRVDPLNFSYEPEPLLMVEFVIPEFDKEALHDLIGAEACLSLSDSEAELFLPLHSEVVLLRAKRVLTRQVGYELADYIEQLKFSEQVCTNLRAAANDFIDQIRAAIDLTQSLLFEALRASAMSEDQAMKQASAIAHLERVLAKLQGVDPHP